MAVGIQASIIADSLLDALVNATSYTGPANIYMKLHVGDPGAAGTSNPATETTRKACTFGAAVNGLVSNDAAMTWTTVAGSEDYTHASFWDDLTAGNFLFSGTITANAVTAGDTFTVPIGDVDVSLIVAA